MKKHAFSLLVCFLVVSAASAEEIMLSTYYPAPAGSYQSLRSSKMCIGASCHAGAAATVVADNDLYVQGDVQAAAFYYVSDERLKENVLSLKGALEKVQALNGVSFNFKDDPGTAKIGLIAQDVEKVIPEVVHTGEDGIKSVEYGNLVALLIEAVKVQQEEIEVLQQKVRTLQEK